MTSRLNGGWVRRILIGFGVVAGVMAATVSLRPVAADEAPSSPAYYTDKVKPILQTNCGKCHFGMNHKGGLSLATRTTTMKGGRDGAVLVPGDPDHSMLMKLIRHQGPTADPKPMPPKSPKMSDADITVIETWIKAGAVMPNDQTPQ